VIYRRHRHVHRNGHDCQQRPHQQSVFIPDHRYGPARAAPAHWNSGVGAIRRADIHSANQQHMPYPVVHGPLELDEPDNLGSR
jgi:hypothetical protein